jgi:hypothetical protein
MMLKGLLRDDGTHEGYDFFGFMKIAWRYIGVAYDIHSLLFAFSAAGEDSRLIDDLVNPTREYLMVWQNKKGRPHRHRPDHTRGTRYKRLHTISICPMVLDRSDLLLTLSLRVQPNSSFPMHPSHEKCNATWIFIATPYRPVSSIVNHRFLGPESLVCSTTNSNLSPPSLTSLHRLCQCPPSFSSL